MFRLLELNNPEDTKRVNILYSLHSGWFSVVRSAHDGYTWQRQPRQAVWAGKTAEERAVNCMALAKTIGNDYLTLEAFDIILLEGTLNRMCTPSTSKVNEPSPS